MSRHTPLLVRYSWALLAISTLGVLAAPITILNAIPDFTTRASRHAFAGALGLVSVTVLEFLIAIFPIRRGERWALAAALTPFAIVAVPVLIVDATNVAPARLWRTLAPQVAGLVLGLASWTLCAVSVIAYATPQQSSVSARTE
jgi:hypothetical protein